MRLKSLLLSAFLLAWPLVTLGLYGWANRASYLHGFLFPGMALFLAHLARLAPLTWPIDLLRAFFGMTFFALAALGLGLILLPRRLLTDSAPLTRGTIAFLLGEIGFSIFFLTVIRLWQLPPWLSAAGLMPPLLLGLPALGRFLRSLPPPALPADLPRADRRLFALTLAVFALGLALSSARLGYDAVAEYFSHAKIMAATHLPVFLYPKDLFVVSSFHPGILFTIQIQLFGDQSARMLSWLNGAAILILLWALGERLGLSSRARLYALMLLVTSTAFLDLLGDGKVELISTAPILAAVYMFVARNRAGTATQDKSCATLAGFLLGFAIISRPYNVFLVPLFVVLFLLFDAIFSRPLSSSFHPDRFARRLPPSPLSPSPFPLSRLFLSPSRFLLSAFITFLLGLFHLWQNALWLGSPLAPLTYARELNSDLWQWQFDPARLPLMKWLYPLTLTFFNTPQSLGNLSPFFAGFLPFLLLPAVRRGLSLFPRRRALLIATLLTLLIWVTFFFTVVEIRYVWFLWILLFLPAAQVIESALEHSGRLVQPLLRPLMALLLMWLGLRTLAIAVDTYSPIDAAGQAHCYDIPFCTFFQLVNETAAPGGRILALNAYRYYLRPDLFACSSRAEEYPALERLARQNSPDFWAEAYRQGFRYVIFEKNFAEFHSHFGAIPASENAPAWLKVTLLVQAKWNAVYRLDAVSPPFAVEKQCRQDESRRWVLTETR